MYMRLIFGLKSTEFHKAGVPWVYLGRARNMHYISVSHVAVTAGV